MATAPPHKVKAATLARQRARESQRIADVHLDRYRQAAALRSGRAAEQNANLV